LSSHIIQQKAEDYEIQSGDEIEISVWGYDEFNTKKTVTSEGYITIPLIGELEAAGLTKDELEASLKEALSEYIRGEINLTLTIMSTQEHIVSVLGSVGRPDNYTITGDMNLFQVLSQAGGTTDQADLRNIKIYKGGQTSNAREIDLTTYLRNENTGSVATVQPGDIVYVPQQENMVRELSGFLRDVVVLFGLFRFLN
jgi:polysaccharide export outer membrane protein